MSRQILTFFIVFAGLMLLLRTCNKEVSAPDAVAREKLQQDRDTTGRTLLEDKERGIRAVLDKDGTLVSLQVNDQWIVRDVNANKRTFHVVERTEHGSTRYLPSEGWSANKVEGGYDFVLEKDDYRIRREIRLAGDGNGLDCGLSIAGAPKNVRGFECTVLSGVPLDNGAGAAAPEPFIVRRVKGGAAQKTSWTTLIQGQESRRTDYLRRLREDAATAGAPEFHERRTLELDKDVELFGVLGATHLVTLHDLPAAAALNTIGYRLGREDDTTRETESWLSLKSIDSGYTGTFRLRWTTRAEAATVEPLLKDVLTGRKDARTTLENGSIRLVCSSRGASVASMSLKQFVNLSGEASGEASWVPMIRDVVRAGRRTLTMRVKNADRYGLDPADATWSVSDKTADSVTYRLETRGWIFEKHIALPAEEDRYALDVIVRVTRPDGSAAENFPYTLVGAAGSYVADTKRGVTFSELAQGFILERAGGDDDSLSIEEAADSGEVLEHSYGKDTGDRLRAVGVRGAFFACILLPSAAGSDSDTASSPRVVQASVRPLKLEDDVEFLDGTKYSTGLQARIDAVQEFDSAGVATGRYTLFAGPAELSRLRPLGIEDAVDFGMFALIGRTLMWLMKMLQGLVGSYGIAIVIMTLIVRALLLPVSYKSQLSVQRYSKRMQKLKPLLEGLEAKFGKNRQKLNQERMKIMRENKVGFPLGCLMMFVQIPIWIALFAALRVEFSLRHQPFLWANDLMMPDRLFGLPFWPHWFNLLPILMLGLWVMQQKLSPQPGSDDPQVQAQMKMVRYMPYVFFFMLYNYASALSVYMCVSSAWGIAEAKLVRRAIKKLDEHEKKT
ncbi:MAG: YidC/Oxa1 family insertase periplasmic-domain containing protein [Planctomycetota bacterium]|jgi:YidC/Oxa1 family membrane protein insertase